MACCPSPVRRAAEEASMKENRRDVVVSIKDLEENHEYQQFNLEYQQIADGVRGQITNVGALFKAGRDDIDLESTNFYLQGQVGDIQKLYDKIVEKREELNKETSSKCFCTDKFGHKKVLSFLGWVVEPITYVSGVGSIAWNAIKTVSSGSLNWVGVGLFGVALLVSKYKSKISEDRSKDFELKLAYEGLTQSVRIIKSDVNSTLMIFKRLQKLSEPQPGPEAEERAKRRCDKIPKRLHGILDPEALKDFCARKSPVPKLKDVVNRFVVENRRRKSQDIDAQGLGLGVRSPSVTHLSGLVTDTPSSTTVTAHSSPKRGNTPTAATIFSTPKRTGTPSLESTLTSVSPIAQPLFVAQTPASSLIKVGSPSVIFHVMGRDEKAI